MNEHTVLLLGRSLLLSGVALGLEESRGLRVEQVCTWAEAEALLASQTPDAIILDLTDADASHVLPLLGQIPRLVVIGLDTHRDQAVLVSGEVTQVPTMAAIRKLVGG